jgi:type I restriction enzyme, S subunit
MADMEMNVPDGWERMNIGQILETTRNGFSGQQVDYITPFPVTRIETISDGKINYEKIGYVKHIPLRYELVKGDMLFSNINSIKHIGKLAYVEEGSVLYHGMNLLLFRFTESVDTRFIYYYLLTRKKWFEQVATQAINQASINQTTLKVLEVIIPNSLSEQRQIARILSKVDEAISQTEQLIAKYRRLKTGLMQDLLTKGIDAHGNIRSEETHAFKDSPLGRIPAEWEVKRLEQTAVNNSPIVYGILMPGKHFSGGVPVVKVKDIFGEKIHVDGLLHTNPMIAESFKRSTLKEGDLLFTIRGTVGRCAFVPAILDGANITQDSARIRIDSSYREYIRYAFETPESQAYIQLNTIGQAVKGINLKALRELRILMPKPDEARRIAEKLNLTNSFLEVELNTLAKLKSQKTGLMQDLLSGKVRVGQLISELLQA